MDEMHGHIYITGYKTSEEYKALYAYYSSMYADPITEGFDASIRELRELTTPDEPDNKAKVSGDEQKNESKNNQKSDQKKKSSAKNKVADRHEKIKEKINEKYPEKGKKNSKKK